MIDILKQCKIEGNVVHLPVWELPDDMFKKIKSFMYKNGGKWITSKQGYEFPYSPETIIKDAISGKNVNIKKQFQFYHTGIKIIDDLKEHFDESGHIWDRFERMLEPSAGQGHILDGIKSMMTKWNNIECCEIMPENKEILIQKGYNVIHDDFMTLDSSHKYDLILANPPFTKNQDIIHISKMYNDHIDEGGYVYSVMRDIFTNPSGREIEAEFIKWFNEHHGWIVNKYKPKDFKNGANVDTVLIGMCKLYG